MAVKTAAQCTIPTVCFSLIITRKFDLWYDNGMWLTKTELVISMKLLGTVITVNYRRLQTVVVVLSKLKFFHLLTAIRVEK